MREPGREGGVSVISDISIDTLLDWVAGELAECGRQEPCYGNRGDELHGALLDLKRAKAALRRAGEIVDEIRAIDESSLDYTDRLPALKDELNVLLALGEDP